VPVRARAPPVAAHCHASFVIAITIPAITKTRIRTCIHSQWRGIDQQT
jgi:hypothetical protein